MVYLEFKTSGPMKYLKRLNYVKAVARVIKGLMWILKERDDHVDIDFKVTFK